MQDQLHTLTSERDTALNDRDVAQNDANDIGSRLARSEADQVTITRRIEGLQAMISSLTTERNSLSAEKAQNSDMIRKMKTTIERISREKEDLQQRYKRMFPVVQNLATQFPANYQFPGPIQNPRAAPSGSNQGTPSSAVSNHALGMPAAPPAGGLLPEPDAFESGDRKALGLWVCQMRLKLELDADQYPTERHRLVFGILKLKGEALASVYPFIRPTPPLKISSLEGLFGRLKNRFGIEIPHSEVVKAGKGYSQSLNQGNEDFESFAKKFYDCAATGDVSEREQMHALPTKIANRLRLAIRGYVPQGIDELVSKLLDIDRSQQMTPKQSEVVGAEDPQSKRRRLNPDIDLTL